MIIKSRFSVRLTVTFLAVFFTTVLHAQVQQVTASSGGILEGDTRQVSFTVGETVVKTHEGQQIMITQGFHQPMLWVTAVDEMEGITFQIKAYPNPATDIVKLTVNEELPIGSSYQLYDMHGGLISTKKIEQLTTEVPFQQLVPASYFLKVVSEDKILKTFKIIKNNR